VVTTYQGRHGDYIILQETPGGFLVRYISGEWKDKEVQMSKVIHNRLQENIEVERLATERLEEEDIQNKLDTWWIKYPALYTSLWQENITGKVLLRNLEEEYPDAASNVSLEV